MTQPDYMALAQKAMPQLQKGAFLTVRTGAALNTLYFGEILNSYEK